VPFYIGDDATDEDAFSALRPYGITVRIGRKIGSHAGFRFKFKIINLLRVVKEYATYFLEIRGQNLGRFWPK